MKALKLLIQAPSGTSISGTTTVTQLMKIENNQLVSYNKLVETMEFHSDEELKKFFEEDCRYKSLALFSIAGRLI